MNSFIVLTSKKKNEINRFLNLFFNSNMNLENDSKWLYEFKNPIEISDIISAYIDNTHNFDLKLWICLDPNILINIADNNANSIIKYLFERFPY